MLFIVFRACSYALQEVLNQHVRLVLSYLLTEAAVGTTQLAWNLTSEQSYHSISLWCRMLWMIVEKSTQVMLTVTHTWSVLLLWSNSTCSTWLTRRDATSQNSKFTETFRSSHCTRRGSSVSELWKEKPDFFLLKFLPNVCRRFYSTVIKSGIMSK